MASGLSTPVGFKNGTDGGLQVAINALQSVSSPHSFLGINQDGQVAVIRTKRQPLRPHRPARRRQGPELRLGDDRAGGEGAGEEQAAGQHRGRLQPRQLQQGSRAAAAGDARLRAPDLEGNQSIVGVMLESNLNAGNQPIPADLSQLQVRRLGHRRLHRLADHREAAARHAREAQGRIAGARSAHRGGAQPARLSATEGVRGERKCAARRPCPSVLADLD